MSVFTRKSVPVCKTLNLCSRDSIFFFLYHRFPKSPRQFNFPIFQFPSCKIPCLGRSLGHIWIPSRWCPHSLQKVIGMPRGNAITLCPLLGCGVMGRSTRAVCWWCLQTAISWTYRSIKMGLGDVHSYAYTRFN